MAVWLLKTSLLDLNVLSLLAGTVPLVCIQLNALQVEEFVLLNFIEVLDQRSLRQDDETEARVRPRIESTGRIVHRPK